MEDEIKYLFLALLFCFTSCTSYYKINRLYDKARFTEAYLLLQKEKPTTPKYKEYEFKLVLQLVLSGNRNFQPLLETLLQKPAPKGAVEAHQLASAWVHYMDAKKDEDFKKILETLPVSELKDTVLEYTRLALQNQSLLNLGRYKEVEVNLRKKADKHSDLSYLLATAYKELGQKDSALSLYTEVIRTSESDILKGLASFHCGEIYEQKQDSAAARKAYLLSWDLASANASLNFKLGRLLTLSGHENLPQRFYRAALRLDENHAEAWYYLNLQ